MIVEQTLFGTTFLSDGNKITVSPILRKRDKGGCIIKIKNNGHEYSFTLSKEGSGELVDIVQKYIE